MPELCLVCEGESDVPILTSVLTGVLHADIVTRSAGGGNNAPSVAEYVARREPDKVVAYVIDRDYRRRRDADATYSDGKRGFMWRRHAIESYLLAPAVIVEALHRLRTSLAQIPWGGPTWANSLPLDEDEVMSGLRACAKLRAPQEAARIALQQLWEDLSDTAGRVQRRSPSALTAGSVDAAACKAALVEEATRLVAAARETTLTAHLATETVERRYDAALARVNAEKYVDELSFLEEFHGRDFIDVFFEWLRQRLGATGLRKKTLIEELQRAVPRAYRSNRMIYGTDDFLDLANGVRALAQLPPVA